MTRAKAQSARALDVLGDPIRRLLLERIAHKAAAVSELSQGLTITAPAISTHLKLLREANLVTSTAIGNRRIYTLNLKGIAALYDWLDDAAAGGALESE